MRVSHWTLAFLLFPITGALLAGGDLREDFTPFHRAPGSVPQLTDGFSDWSLCAMESRVETLPPYLSASGTVGGVARFSIDAGAEVLAAVGCEVEWQLHALRIKGLVGEAEQVSPEFLRGPVSPGWNEYTIDLPHGWRNTGVVLTVGGGTYWVSRGPFRYAGGNAELGTVVLESPAELTVEAAGGRRAEGDAGGDVVLVGLVPHLRSGALATGSIDTSIRRVYDNRELKYVNLPPGVYVVAGIPSGRVGSLYYDESLVALKPRENAAVRINMEGATVQRRLRVVAEAGSWGGLAGTVSLYSSYGLFLGKVALHSSEADVVLAQHRPYSAMVVLGSEDSEHDAVVVVARFTADDADAEGRIDLGPMRTVLHVRADDGVTGAVRATITRSDSEDFVSDVLWMFVSVDVALSESSARDVRGLPAGRYDVSYYDERGLLVGQGVAWSRHASAQ